ncbi:AEC family transporter [Microcella pacifica]|uniref:AEC family transporter n=1 Tax=Microcella pacifica TaxID=2591847 RepID=A0A9E5MIC2_9MICO|nr:AEC family transporter [Microcella pacifica]NHF63485.1 AEC family transporter [Microcella pacifica]
MAGVLIGFAIIGSVIAVGYVVGRLGVLGPTATVVLGRAAFFVFLPALLFSVMAEADLAELFSALLPVSAIAALSCMLAFVLLARLLWRRGAPALTIGALASGYVNANNIGLPVAAYVIGDPTLVAPVILLQLVVFAPIALTILDVTTSGRLSIGRVLTQPVRNPLIIASVLGLVVALIGVDLPDPVVEPFRLLGAAAVPTVLFVFGLSLHGRRILEPGSGRRDVLLAVILKSIVMPLVAWGLGALAFGLDGVALFTVVVLAALPTAQNVYTYAARYQTAMPLARDSGLITTALAVPILIVVAALLAP